MILERRLTLVGTWSIEEPAVIGAIMKYVACSFVITTILALVAIPSARELSFEERVQAQEAIEGVYAAHREGPGSPSWRVVDYGGLMVHIMRPQARDFYQLDKLYDSAKRFPWEAPAVKTNVKKSATQKKKTIRKKTVKKKAAKKKPARRKKK